MVVVSPPPHADTASIVPVEQTLELSLDPRRGEWHGTLGATLRVRREARDIVLCFAGPTVTRVEMTDDTGRVDLVWGARGADSLLIETRRPLRPGRAELAVSFEGNDAGGPAAFVRDGAATRIALVHGAGRVFPAWTGAPPATRWNLILHVPAGFVARSNLARSSVVPVKGWNTFTDRSRTALRADELRFRVEPVRVRARVR